MNTIFSFSFLSFLTYHAQTSFIHKEFNFVTSHHKQDGLNFKRGHSFRFFSFSEPDSVLQCLFEFQQDNNLFFFRIIHGKGKGG
jgi:hypothetical protein